MAAPKHNSELKEQLRAKFVGKTLNEVPTPSVILDVAKVEVNCERMLEATERLGLLWRAHIKSHKTTELTRLQVGDALTTPVSIIVSTITEAENIVPLLQEYQSRGRSVNILFSFPLFPTALPRLAALTRTLASPGPSPGPSPSSPSTLSLMIDHPAQLTTLTSTSHPHPSQQQHPPQIYLKIDTAYGRAGVPPSTPACTALIAAALEAEGKGVCVLHGIYSHAGHSYAAREGVQDVLGYLKVEFEGLAGVAREVVAARAARAARAAAAGGEGVAGGGGGKRALVLSVGATPTATVVQQEGVLAAGAGAGAGGGEVGRLVEELKGEGFVLEVHAGVYPTLDMQQLATHARDASLMTADDIAISVLAEVASLYPSRGANGTTEALINAGTLALGREPVTDKGKAPGQDYAGWGFIMPWGLDNPVPGPDFPRVHDGWRVGRISQEHGILTWQGKGDEVPLQYGQKVRVWPNHSCIAGSGFDWYLIVDSRNKGREDEVVDVWPRWHGW